jgi:hypothetical protein
VSATGYFFRFFRMLAMYAFAAALPLTSLAGRFPLAELRAERFAPRALARRFTLRFTAPATRRTARPAERIAPPSIDCTAGVC